tara:strand:- start:13 stop:588 length:576 start_codon:yes stop_codon:yes gene_type:complete
MKAVQYVQKDSSISGGGANYKAVSHDQVVSVIRQELVNNGIVIFPNQVSGEFLIKRDLAATPPVKMGLYSGTYEIHFVNIDNGEDRVISTIHSHANDNGDKAPGKAASYATKTAMLKVFSLETGENDESRADIMDFDLINQEQQGQLFNLLCDSATSQYTEKGLKICRAFKFQNISDIRAKQYDKILKAAS